ncbi:serine/threonine-protein kinase [Streptomyces muensis]|uniref:Serine/threonine protein kinase n=1 Tax=Streptomyces muensis TaxID=1077944 RepID=A0A9X1Q586_STRM4|nr:serine/threonine-protein kinase [Streptomyces muensis]MCF1599167.1 serine/threonine protein kinase [Streptomyces muensis]
MTLRDDIDFGRSRAILLGTSEYTAGFEDRRPMPAALQSLKEMRGLLTGPGEWPKDRVKTFQNQRDSNKVLRDIVRLIDDVDDVLLFYYVGHGQLLHRSNGRFDLGLALTDTSEDATQRSLTSLRFRELREQIERSNARIKIFILDCCCAGIATRYAEPAANVTAYADSATPARGAGTYIWAACGRSQLTYFEDRKGGLTYFTKSLAEAVREAHGEQSLGATVANLHDDVRRRLREASIQNADDPPVPDLLYSGRPDQFLFVRGQVALRGGEEFRYESLKKGDPHKVGPYVLHARLGMGGAGQVFLAFTPGGQPIAVKVLKAELGQDQEFADRFPREIEVAQRVRSSDVAQLVNADPRASEPWLASTYVCGPSLLELVREAGPLPGQDVLLIASGIARALRAIHEAGAVHRDLKPANVMLDETGPKVIDFGIAKSIAATLMTRTNVQLGTPAYRSPEQATGRRSITAKSDIFTLGATIYFLATGKDAFQAEDPLGIIHLIANEEPDLSGLSPEVRVLVQRCLAKDPDRRPTAAEVVEICAAAAGPVTPGAYLPVRMAAPAIHSRNQALRRLMQAADVPRPSQQPQPPPFTPPDGPAGPDLGPGIVITPPPPPTPPVNQQARGALIAVLAVVCAVLLIWLPGQLAGGDDGDDQGGSTPPTSYTSSYTEPDTSEETEPADDPTTDEADTPTPTESPSPTSLMETADSGDCLANDGTYTKPDLRFADCAAGVFKVAQALDGTSDTSECSDVADTDYSVSNSYVNRVLCLTYQNGSAYHAEPGDCVYGPNARGSNWSAQGCRTGNFTVKARLTGTSDKSRCESYSGVEQTLTTTTKWDELDVVQCLAMNFPNAAARAPVGSCLLMTGSGQSTDFQTAACSQANVSVVGRSSQYYNVSYCGSYGWTTWRSSDFPKIAYTVCFKRI